MVREYVFLNFFSRLNSSRKHTANYLGRKTSLKIRQITQGKDGHGLKLIKVGQHFSISTGMLQAAKKENKTKNKQIIWGGKHPLKLDKSRNS